MPTTRLKSAAATLAHILEKKQKAGVERLWLGSDGTAALKALAAATEPADPRETLADLERALSRGDLNSLGDRPVFSSGTPDARIVFVGDAPGTEEEDAGEPFVGPAGQKLDGILRAMGVKRDKVYLTNVLKFRPLDGRPSGAEIDHFRPTLLAEINAVDPDIIIALGDAAVHALSPENHSAMNARGAELKVNNRRLIATHHPSHLIAKEAEGAEPGRLAKRELWEDMLRILEALNLPISTKQQGFFK